MIPSRFALLGELVLEPPPKRPHFEVDGEVQRLNEYVWIEERVADGRYRLCESLNQLYDYVSATPDGDELGADFETTSLNVYDGSCRPVGLSLSNQTDSGLYVPVGHMGEGLELNLPWPAVLEALKQLDQTRPTIWYNYRYDGHNLWRWAGRTWEPARWEDALLLVYLDHSDEKDHRLKTASRRLLGLPMHEYAEVVGTTAAYGFAMVHPLDAVPYACPDADLPRRLFRKLLPKIVEEGQQMVYRLEKLLIPAMRPGMEQGIYLDDTKLDHMVTEMTAVEAAVAEEVFTLAGEPFDTESPVAVGKVLAALRVPITEKTAKTKQMATGKEVLARYAAEFPICRAITQLRETRAFRRNYVEKLAAAAHRFSGQPVRFAFNPIGAPTGRMSCGGEGQGERAYAKGYVDVNVQSTPDPEKEADKPVEQQKPDLRAAFLACPPDEVDETGRPAWVIVSMDYSQIEMRIAANLSGARPWIDAFLQGEDIHLTNARLAYADKAIPDGDPRRKKGKTMGFAILYQAGYDTVAAHGGITAADAKRLIETFYGQAPEVDRWVRGVKAEVARRPHEARTWYHRRRRFADMYATQADGAPAPKWLRAKAEREAVNHTVQGGAADIFKIATRAVHVLLTERGWHADCQQVLWVHDEIVFRVRRSRVAEIVPVLQACLETRCCPKDWVVPLKAEAKVGDAWSPQVPLAEWLQPPAPPDPWAWSLPPPLEISA